MHTPLEGPFGPHHPIFPRPGNTVWFDLGFPPPSHAHINPRVPGCNGELPNTQAVLTDFAEVLRKNHAIHAAWPGALSGRNGFRCNVISCMESNGSWRSSDFAGNSPEPQEGKAGYRCARKGGGRGCRPAFSALAGAAGDSLGARTIGNGRRPVRRHKISARRRAKRFPTILDFRNKK